MRNLFNFIAKHYFFFLFVLLQVIAFTLIVQNNFYHRSAFVNSANFLSGSIYQSRTNVSQYFALKSINEELAARNNALMDLIPGSYLRTDSQIFTFNDTLHRKQFSYINARVINNSVQNRNNYITLDKGRLHGIKPDMGVILPNGVVGIVKDVSSNFSAVLSFLHSDIQVSVRHKKSNHLGTVFWEGYDYQKTTMLYIPPHVDLQIGDTITTSGFSHIFPQDIIIGTISDFEIRRGDNFYTIEIDLEVDFNNLNYVNVVRSIYRSELIQLEESARQP